MIEGFKDKISEINPPGPNGQGENEPVLASREKILIAGIWLDLVDMPEGSPPLRIKDGKILMDAKRYSQECEDVKKALADSIEKKDEDTFNKMTGGLGLAEDEEVIDLYIKLKKLFKSGNAKKLDSINVDFLTDGIAQRNIMREGLKPQVAKLPFSFVDRNGAKLDIERDLDIVFVKDKSGGYKLIVGSKKGIDEIEVPDNISSGKFQPDFLKIDKDAVTDTITIPLRPAKDGSESYVDSIEIRKGPIDLTQKLAREESEEQAKKAKKRRERDSSNYSPPPARSPSRSSESGGYGYTRVSG
jgi:hypothetical protein